MPDLTPRIVAILARYMRDPASPVVNGTRLSDLEIDLLDLPMVVLDVEEVFDIHFRYDDAIEDIKTVGDLVASVASHLEAKALRSRTFTPRIKRPWTSTGARP